MILNYVSYAEGNGISRIVDASCIEIEHRLIKATIHNRKEIGFVLWLILGIFEKVYGKSRKKKGNLFFVSNN